MANQTQQIDVQAMLAKIAELEAKLQAKNTKADKLDDKLTIVAMLLDPKLTEHSQRNRLLYNIVCGKYAVTQTTTVGDIRASVKAFRENQKAQEGSLGAK